MEEQKVKYPIGEQDFKMLREEGFHYVDKTRYIEQIKDGSKYIFLARPRRFGKSLFLSTLQYFFEGERELFKGLYIDSIDWDWTPYPVLRLDLNSDSYDDPSRLDAVLDNIFSVWEGKFDIEERPKELSQRFNTIIRRAYETTGRPVVILVDEYDKPLVSNIHNKENIEHYRNRLSAIYSNFKSSAQYIRLVFLTGVSRFGKLSVFSDLNNLRDVSFLDEYSDICGITERELLENFQIGISGLAEKNGISYKDACRNLKKNYDGYRFARNGSDIYNPWSLLNAMASSEISNYWNDTGMPKLVAKTLKRVQANLQEMFDTYCTEDDLKGLDLLSPQPLALLYQTGYLTIKDYEPKIKRYRLGIPNNEVKDGLFKVLLPYYVKSQSDKEEKKIISDMVMFLMGDV
ncbi:MAG: AAA family ATPase [Bacteroides sp.]|nr:AAA family ATPase [Bacteroides sp.]